MRGGCRRIIGRRIGEKTVGRRVRMGRADIGKRITKFTECQVITSMAFEWTVLGMATGRRADFESSQDAARGERNPPLHRQTGSCICCWNGHGRWLGERVRMAL